MAHHASARMRRLALLGGVCVIALLAFAGVANASTAEVDGTTLSYTAAAGETNNVQLAFNGGTGEVTLTDSGVGTLPVPDNTNASGGDCQRPDNTHIVCTGLTDGVFTLDDMNDTLNASAIPSPGSVSVSGGPGNDTITGSQGDDFLDGQTGTDTVNGSGGSDELDDTSDAGDTIHGD